MQNKIVTLDEFIIRTEKENPKSTGSFSRLLRDIGIAAKIVNREVNKAGLVNILGVEGSTIRPVMLFRSSIFLPTKNLSKRCLIVEKFVELLLKKIRISSR